MISLNLGKSIIANKVFSAFRESEDKYQLARKIADIADKSIRCQTHRDFLDAAIDEADRNNTLTSAKLGYNDNGNFADKWIVIDDNEVSGLIRINYLNLYGYAMIGYKTFKDWFFDISHPEFSDRRKVYCMKRNTLVCYSKKILDRSLKAFTIFNDING